FLEYDKFIIQSSMHNLTVPTMLKAYIDTILMAGKTFKYTAEGPQGLMTGKIAIHIHGSGGTYSTTTGVEHADSYIKGSLKFIGLDVLESIFVEGIDFDPSKKEEIMKAALEKAEVMAKKF
ncbi:MAG: NAD(P)H-dependent oxidoreductase, partial [Defluviitaleaceae bacterium]|nr:NAD(P)H-dependent oxidoreductase [Defluviitaleaceae bacterium]